MNIETCGIPHLNGNSPAATFFIRKLLYEIRDGVRSKMERTRKYLLFH